MNFLRIYIVKLSSSLSKWQMMINNSNKKDTLIDQFRYIKIQSQTMDFRARRWGINPTNSVFIPQSLVLRSIV